MLSTRVVRLLGALAILMAVAYFIAVFIAFKAGVDDPFGQHFMRLGILYVYGPVLSLTLYFYARVNLGRRLLERDRAQEALAYSLPKIAPDFWLRGKREAALHAAIALRASLKLNQLDQAKQLVATIVEGGHYGAGAQGLQLGRFVMEALLRAEDLVSARAHYERFARIDRPKRDRAPLIAARAELAARSRQWDDYERLLADAYWSNPQDKRAKLTEALAISWREPTPEDAQRALELLEDAQPEADATIPTRAAELELVRAQLLERAGASAPAAQALARAQQLASDGPCDQRAQHLVEQALEKATSSPE